MQFLSANRWRRPGGAGSGTADDTPVLQREIDRVAAQGGGTLYVPPGHYLCYSLHLRSGVQLYLDAGAVLQPYQGEAAAAAKRPVRANQRALLCADGIANAAIIGAGVIDGRMTERCVALLNCRAVRVSDVTVLDSVQQGIFLHGCEDALLRAVRISSSAATYAFEAVSISNCCGVSVAGCFIDSAGSGIVVNSPGEGRCEDVSVTGCFLRTQAVALSVVSGNKGQVGRVLFSGCMMREVYRAIQIRARAGGACRNLVFADLMISAGSRFPVSCCVAGGQDDDNMESSGTIRELSLHDIHVKSRGRCYVSGTQTSPVRDLSIRNLSWFADGLVLDEEAGQAMAHIRVERADETGRPGQFLFFNVEGAHLDGLRLSSSDFMDRRSPLVVAENVTGTFGSRDLSDPDVLEPPLDGVSWT